MLVFIASFAGTLTGFGTSTILIPFLSLLFPFPATLLFVGIIHWFGDIWKMVFFKKGTNWKLILLFGIPGIVIGYLASQLPTTLPEEYLNKTLGIFLMFYVIYVYKNPKWKLKKTNINAITGGSLSGLFAGIFGVGGAVRSTFLSAFDLNKSVYIFTSGAIAFLIDSARITGYLQGSVNINDFGLTVLFMSIVISLLGAYIAKNAVDKIPQKKFRFIILIALLVVSLRYLAF